MVLKPLVVLLNSQNVKRFFVKCLFYGIFENFLQSCSIYCSTKKCECKPLCREADREVFVLGQFIRKFSINHVSKADLLPLKHISVNVRRYAYITMTEVFRDHFQVYTAVQQKLCVAMSELMKR